MGRSPEIPRDHSAFSPMRFSRAAVSLCLESRAAPLISGSRALASRLSSPLSYRGDSAPCEGSSRSARQRSSWFTACSGLTAALMSRVADLWERGAISMDMRIAAHRSGSPPFEMSSCRIASGRLTIPSGRRRTRSREQSNSKLLPSAKPTAMLTGDSPSRSRRVKVSTRTDGSYCWSKNILVKAG